MEAVRLDEFRIPAQDEPRAGNASRWGTDERAEEGMTTDEGWERRVRRW